MIDRARNTVTWRGNWKRTIIPYSEVKAITVEIPEERPVNKNSMDMMWALSGSNVCTIVGGSTLGTNVAVDVYALLDNRLCGQIRFRAQSSAQLDKLMSALSVYCPTARVCPARVILSPYRKVRREDLKRWIERYDEAFPGIMDLTSEGKRYQR